MFLTKGEANLSVQDQKSVRYLAKQATGKVLVQTDKSEGHGSGFFISDKLFVTNWHVIEGAVQATIEMANKKEYTCLGLRGHSVENDLAIVEIKERHDEKLELGTSSNLESLMNQHNEVKVYSFGNPTIFKFQFSNGILKNINKKGEVDYGKFNDILDRDHIIFSGDIDPGSSGGPLMNEHGEVIGIVFATAVQNNNNFAIPVDNLKPILNNLYPLKLFGSDLWMWNLLYLFISILAFGAVGYSLLKFGPRL